MWIPQGHSITNSRQDNSIAEDPSASKPSCFSESESEFSLKFSSNTRHQCRILFSSPVHLALVGLNMFPHTLSKQRSHNSSTTTGTALNVMVEKTLSKVRVSGSYQERFDSVRGAVMASSTSASTRISDFFELVHPQRLPLQPATRWGFLSCTSFFSLRSVVVQRHQLMAQCGQLCAIRSTFVCRVVRIVPQSLGCVRIILKLSSVCVLQFKL